MPFLFAVRSDRQVLWQVLASLIFALFGIAQNSLDLLSLFIKTGLALAFELPGYVRL
jgi:hypothetical protein